MSFCGTDESCPECPLSTSAVEQGAYGVFNPGYQEAEQIGAMVERLHDHGCKSLSGESAQIVLVASGIGANKVNISKFQAAVERQATFDCTAASLRREF